MAFITNGSGFTLGEGTYNNIQGDLNIYHGVKRRRGEIEDAQGPLELLQPARKRRQEEEHNGFKMVREKHLSLKPEIGSGPGYLLHAGEIKGRAVIVKVFDAGLTAREQMESTISLSKQLWHPNVLRIEGVSSPASTHHFITYENGKGLRQIVSLVANIKPAHWKTAQGPLAAALNDNLDRSIILGFKLVAGLSSGINYLTNQNASLSLRAENFDVFLDINERFLLSINPPTNIPEHDQRDTFASSWQLFNALCQKVLRSANRVLHDEDIDRTPVAFSLPPRSNWSREHLPASLLPLQEQTIAESDEEPVVYGDNGQKRSPVPPRREYVWRTGDLPQSLATIADQINWDIDVRRSSIQRLAWNDGRSIHRCPGYVREEVTLATRTTDSAVVSHDAPTPLEVCSVCNEVVNSEEVFRCVCGDPNPGSRFTVKCQSCKYWCHSDCIPNSNESVCPRCVSTTSLDFPGRSKDGWPDQLDGQAPLDRWEASLRSAFPFPATYSAVSTPASVEHVILPNAQQRDASPDPVQLAARNESAGPDGGEDLTSNAPIAIPGDHDSGTSGASGGPTQLLWTTVAHVRRKQGLMTMCPVPGCRSTFTVRNNLRNHIRYHYEEKPFICNCPGCGKGFTRLHNCKRHEQLHENYRPWPCERCNKQFVRMDALHRHLRSEGGAECRRALEASWRLPDFSANGGGAPGGVLVLGSGDLGAGGGARSDDTGSYLSTPEPIQARLATPTETEGPWANKNVAPLPTDTLYVGCLPVLVAGDGRLTPEHLETALRDLFSACQGFQRITFQHKANGPMCLVEFENMQCATKTFNELPGHILGGLMKDGSGIRIYRRNPLGVPTISFATRSCSNKNGLDSVLLVCRLRTRKQSVFPAVSIS